MKVFESILVRTMVFFASESPRAFVPQIRRTSPGIPGDFGISLHNVRIKPGLGDSLAKIIAAEIPEISSCTFEHGFLNFSFEDAELYSSFKELDFPAAFSLRKSATWHPEEFHFGDGNGAKLKQKVNLDAQAAWREAMYEKKVSRLKPLEGIEGDWESEMAFYLRDQGILGTVIAEAEFIAAMTAAFVRLLCLRDHEKVENFSTATLFKDENLKVFQPLERYTRIGLLLRDQGAPQQFNLGLPPERAERKLMLDVFDFLLRMEMMVRRSNFGALLANVAKIMDDSLDLLRQFPAHTGDSPKISALSIEIAMKTHGFARAAWVLCGLKMAEIRF